MTTGEDSAIAGGDEDMSFEDALQRLEAVANALDEGNLTLQESIELFEEGMQLVEKCHRLLSEADGRIEKLIEISESMVDRVAIDPEMIE